MWYAWIFLNHELLKVCPMTGWLEAYLPSPYYRRYNFEEQQNRKFKFLWWADLASFLNENNIVFKDDYMYNNASR